ncbi:MAG: hypothetical protein ABIP51_12580 [Bacteroidia bacterium]
MELNKAIEEAIKFGFTKQLILVNGVIKKLFSEKDFLKEEFAIVKTYPVNSTEGYTGTISYVVLNDCTLGYLLKHRKRRLRKQAVEKHSHFER